MPISSDLPDKIDDSLAKGIAKELFSEIETITGRNFGKPVINAGSKTLKLRQKSCRILRKVYEPLVFDAMALDEYRTLKVMYLRPGLQGYDRKQKMLSVSVDTVRLVVQAPLDPMGRGMPTDIQTNAGVAAISLHAVERSIQDAGVRSIKGLMDVFGRAINWAGIANVQRHEGPFLVPAESGLVCCDTLLPARAYEGAPVKNTGVLVKTFIDLERMGPATRARWDHLVDFGGLQHVPRALSDKHATFEESLAFRFMVEEGRKWAERNAQEDY
ncbi:MULTISPECIES: hypothetical protein [unclassified Ruegeria]|uniref:hypothetical protein n=1 Tax=unclassified Ruegeria TaxID=2625375 RepID=UPI001ADC67D2|nr:MULTISPECIES: hypothetical protein [unclassified Ruegeria]MBO9413666.1 hypothetical protein [Ruegeria sp. R8_1]MBO9417727.1 hypothetical protein [Ruegeria sp. R8_2]